MQFIVALLLWVARWFCARRSGREVSFKERTTECTQGTLQELAQEVSTTEYSLKDVKLVGCDAQIDFTWPFAFGEDFVLSCLFFQQFVVSMCVDEEIMSLRLHPNNSSQHQGTL